MSIKVHIRPEAHDIEENHGIGRVVHAQYEHLPRFDIELVGRGDRADVYVGHTQRFDMPRVDVLQCHGLYWTGDRGMKAQYNGWHHGVNYKIVEAARQAVAVTVPSEWVALPFKRDMRIEPKVIGHGIDFDEWNPGYNDGYILWNKNRTMDVCDPTPAWELARRGVKVVSTFAPPGKSIPDAMRVIGRIPSDDMREVIRNAGIYLATTQETFGIGTLEAMACGVPVLGYDWGGTSSIVTHKKDGYLVQPGDVEGLIAGLDWLTARRGEIGQQTRETARRYDWPGVISQYAELFRDVAEGMKHAPSGVSVVVTCHNYAAYVGDAIESALSQTQRPNEIIVVDDGSTDNSLEVMGRYARNPGLKIITQPNRGVAAARTAGIAAATQEYIVCLDADDRIETALVEMLHRAMLADRALGIAYTGIKVNYPDGTFSIPEGWPPDFSWHSQSVVSNPPSNCIPSACMFRREMWRRAGPHRQEYAPGEDTEFWTRGLSVGFTAKKVTNEPLFWYRAHPNSASRRLSYKPIDDRLPWMRDGLFPLGAPLKDSIAPVRSYSKPVVSVIIPVGEGHGKYLPDALESLLGQNFREWEAIIVDDAHGEKPGLDHYLQGRYPFAVRARTASKKRGASHARNVGLKLARAPLVLFLDADDMLAPDALTEMVRAYTASDGRYVYTDYYMLNEAGETTRRDSGNWRQEVWQMDKEPGKRGLHGVTALVPRQWVLDAGGFDATMPGWEEGDLYTRLAISGYCGYRLDRALLIYRTYSGNGRNGSHAQADTILARVREKYGEYLNGGKAMGKCCGGNADAIMAAKEIIGEVPPSVYQEPPAGMVRMEYIGDKVGAITFFGAGGRQYRGGNNNLERYANVDPNDVAKLKASGAWRPVIVTPITAQPVQPAQKDVAQWAIA